MLIGYFLLFLKPATFLPNDDRVAPLTETAQEREDARQEAIENIPDVSDSFIDPSSDASGVFTPQEIIIPDDWVTYTNEEIGFEFSYPPEYGEVVYDRETGEGEFSNFASTPFKDETASLVDFIKFKTYSIKAANDLEQRVQFETSFSSFDVDEVLAFREGSQSRDIHGREFGLWDNWSNHHRGPDAIYLYNLESPLFTVMSFEINGSDQVDILKSFQNI